MQGGRGAVDTATLLTVKEVATRLRMSPATVYALCAHGRLPHARISTHAIRIAASDLAAFVESSGMRR